MKTVYRTLVLRFDLLLLPSGDAEKIPKLLKVQEEFRKWVTEWVKSGGSLPPPRNNPLKYFAICFIYAGGALDWLKKKTAEVRKMRLPLIFDAQLRLNKERDMGKGVFVDLPKREVRVRKWSGKRGETIVLPLGDKAVKWILARVREGGRLVLAAVWIGASRRSRAAKLYVALTFRREATPTKSKRLLIIDFNALHNGVSYAVVEGEKIITKGVLRPDTSKIVHMQKVASKLDSVCAKKDKACDVAMAAKSRVWRLLRVWEDEVAKKLMRLALQYRAAVIADLPRDDSIRKLKDGYISEKKIFLNFGRLWERLKGLAEWHGVPCHSVRLYSTICPKCGSKMKEVPNRRVKCACGFEAFRDEVPFYWAMRLSKLSSFSSPFPLRRPRPLLLAEVNSLKIRAVGRTALPAWED